MRKFYFHVTSAYYHKDERLLWRSDGGPLTGVIWQHQGWMRLFGWGVQWKSSIVRPVLFSERKGYTKFLHVGPWRLRWLEK